MQKQATSNTVFRLFLFHQTPAHFKSKANTRRTSSSQLWNHTQAVLSGRATRWCSRYGPSSLRLLWTPLSYKKLKSLYSVQSMHDQTEIANERQSTSHCCQLWTKEISGAWGLQVPLHMPYLSAPIPHILQTTIDSVARKTSFGCYLQKHYDAVTQSHALAPCYCIQCHHALFLPCFGSTTAFPGKHWDLIIISVPSGRSPLKLVLWLLPQVCSNKERNRYLLICSIASVFWLQLLPEEETHCSQLHWLLQHSLHTRLLLQT